MRAQQSRNPITLALCLGLAFAIPAGVVYLLWLLLGDMSPQDKVFLRGATFALILFVGVILVLSLFLSTFVRATLRNQIDIDELRANRYNASKVTTHHHYPQELPAGSYPALSWPNQPGLEPYPIANTQYPVMGVQPEAQGNDIVLQ